MAKRFTDTGKWDKAWFRKLPSGYKCVWIFLCDRCDHAGVWDIDEDAFSYFVGHEFTIDEVTEKLGEKVRRVDDKLVIEGFADFQYGALNPENRVHKSVLARLEKIAPMKGLERAVLGPKDTDTDKDTDKDKDPAKLLFNIWNENHGLLPALQKLTDKRKAQSRAQFEKHPDPDHWLSVLKRWKASEFCITKWRPNYDDWLSEGKRVATLEGRYDNRGSTGKGPETGGYAERDGV